MVELEKRVSASAWRPKATTSIRSVVALDRDEGARRGRRVCERRAAHRLRAVDREDDALDAPEVHGLDAGHRYAVLLEAGATATRRRDDSDPHLRVTRRVDAGDADSSDGGSRERERRGSRRLEGHPPHYRPPP